jgi:hypothetical protein
MSRVKKDKDILSKGIEGKLKADDLYSPTELKTRKLINDYRTQIAEQKLKVEMIGDSNPEELGKALKKQRMLEQNIENLMKTSNFTPDEVLAVRAEIFNDSLSNKYQSLLKQATKKDLTDTTGRYSSLPLEAVINRGIQPATSTIIQKDFTLPQPADQLLTPVEEARRLEQEKVQAALKILLESGRLDPITGELK